MGDAEDEALEMVMELQLEGLSEVEAMNAVEHCLSPTEALERHHSELRKVLVDMIVKESDQRGDHLTPEEASSMLSSGQIQFTALKSYKEDYYWLTGEVLTEEQFLQDCTDDGLFEVPKKEKPLWTLGDTPEREGKPKPFGFNSNARGPDEVNL